MIATIILICLESARFFIPVVNHGKQKDDSKYNILTGFFVMAVDLTLYYFAGLFDKF